MASTSSSLSKPETGNLIDRLKTYLIGVKTEWTKITWPTPVQLWAQILIVIGMVTLMTLILWVIDNTLRFSIHAITPHI